MCIWARDLTVDAGGKRILDHVSLHVPRQRLVAIIGPNGSGKTTLLRALAGIISHEGQVRVCEPYSYMPAQPQVDPLALSVDVVKAGLYGSQGSLEEAMDWARKLGVDELVYRRFSTLSSGEKRLVCILRALARRPIALLLDEPLSFLDVSNQALVLRVLREYARLRGASVIVTTHELHYLSYFDEILLLDGGRVRFQGPPEELGEEVIEDVYGVKVVMLKPGVFVPAELLGKASAR